MNPLGDARPARPPARSRRARLRHRHRARRQLAAVAPVGPRAERLDDPGGPTWDTGPAPPLHEPDWLAALRPPDPVGDPGPPDTAPWDRLPARAPAGTAGAGTAGTTMTMVEEPPPAEMDETPPGGRRRSSATRNTVEWVVIIGAALLAALLIKTYLLQAFYIPSASMEPTLEIQDRVLVNKLSYRLHDVHRGDVVVFERPPNDTGQIRDLIKRVIALPGETVEGKDGTVYVDGRPLREPYLPKGTVTGQFGPQHVPDGYVWVMGDNRGNSSDSRVFGAISESRIIGRAFVRVWPVSAFSLL